MKVCDRKTGEIMPVYFFVDTLGASELLYAEASPSIDMQFWITGHIHMFQYFGGTTEIQSPHLEMACHYNIVVIPARVRKPRNKSLAEYAVQLV